MKPPLTVKFGWFCDQPNGANASIDGYKGRSNGVLTSQV